MRVITGTARGRRLKELEGMETRPTTGRPSIWADPFYNKHLARCGEVSAPGLAMSAPASHRQYAQGMQ